MFVGFVALVPDVLEVFVLVESVLKFRLRFKLNRTQLFGQLVAAGRALEQRLVELI